MERQNRGKALQGFHSLDGLKWQYTNGVRDPEKISPDNWNVDLRHLSREENDEIQLTMFYSYQTNVPFTPNGKLIFVSISPPTLIDLLVFQVEFFRGIGFHTSLLRNDLQASGVKYYAISARMMI